MGTTAKRIGAILLIATLALTSCTKKIETVKILQTSDIHGSIFPYNFITNRPQATSLAHVSAFVKHERAKTDQTVILLDNGDILQGQPTVYYSNFIDTSNQNIVARTFNYLQYDAATYGNHDIETGPKIYYRVTEESNFPWLAANVTNTSTGECNFKPYTIIKRNGIKVAVIGLITPHIPNWLPERLWPNMKFEDMINCAEKWLKIVKEKENPDIIAGLFHAGHDYTYGGGSADECCNENASVLVAMKTAGFDVIMIGHDHDAYCQKLANINGDSVLIVDPASNAKYVAQTTITIHKGLFGRIRSKEVKGELIPMDTVKYDEDFMSKFGDDYNRVKNFVNNPIGEFTQTMSSQNAFVEPTAFIDFIHKNQLSITGADISFAAPLSFVSTIKKGKITVSDMFKLYRFENFLNTMVLTGDEIDKYLEYTATLWFNTMTSANDHILNFKMNPDGTIAQNNQGKAMLEHNFYSFDSAAGIIYTIDATKPEGQKVTIVSMADGTPFDPSKKYKVAINSYRANGGGGHLSKGAGLTSEEIKNRQISSTDTDLRLIMMKYIMEHKVINPQTISSWKLVPEKWTKNASKRDMDILFPPHKK